MNNGTGDKKPTIKQLYKVAEVYKRPFAIFYFPEPLRHFKPLKDFRKFPFEYIALEEEEEYKLEKELLLFLRKREHAIELSDLLGSEIPEFKIGAKSNEDPVSVANLIIKDLKINHRQITALAPGYDALNYWKSFLKSKGILVFQSSGIPVDVMRGVCIAKKVLPFIIINSNDSPNGRIFSLFHELAHLVLREDGISNFRHSKKDVFDKMEIFATKSLLKYLYQQNYCWVIQLL